MSLLRRLCTFSLAIVLTTLVVVGTVVSQSNEVGSGLSVSPTRTELSINPGGTDVVKLSLRNVTNNAIVAKPVVNDFTSDDDTGEPQLIVNEERGDLPSIRPFLTRLVDVPLKKGESKTVEIPVVIPDSAAPGGYYGIVRYIAVPEGAVGPDPGQVSLTASISSIVLIEVPGDISEQVQLKDILVYRKNVAGSFFASKPENVGIKIVNQGNGFTKPFGNVTIKNPLGRDMQTYELNTGNPRSNVLPQSTRVFRDKLTGVNLPGRYTVAASVSFGNGGEVLTMSKSFWYLPWWSMLLLILLIVLIALSVRMVRRRLSSGRFKKPTTPKAKKK